MTRWTVQLRLGLALVVGMLAVAACGGGGPSTAKPGGSSSVTGTAAAPTTIPPACDLLTDADIAEITGTTVVSKDNDVADTIYDNHCRWTVQRPDGGNGKLNLGIKFPDGRELFDHMGGPSGLEPIEGLPADAAGGDADGGLVYAVRGDTIVDVHTVGVGSFGGNAVELARRALERLGGSTAPAGTPGTGGGIQDDSCHLLSDEDILEVTGYPALGHKGYPVGTPIWDATCRWEVDSGQSAPATITVNIKSPGGRASWDQMVVPVQGTFTAIDDLGDAAFGQAQSPTSVLIGDTYVGVKYLDHFNPEEFSTELARRVVANLDG